MNPKISVIMLTYNRETLVSRAIESILQQTFTDFEYIIVDNGSSDRSGIIADEYAMKNENIKVIHIKKSTIGAGRNIGLDIACGDYITFIDDDDYAEPEMLDFLYVLAKKNNADISICGSWREANGIKTKKYIFNEVMAFDAEQGVFEMLRREYFNSGTPTKLFSHTVFCNLRFPVFGKYEDIRTTYKIFAQAQNIVALGKPLYTAVRHPQNNSKFWDKDDRINSEHLHEYISAFHKRTAYLTEMFPAKSQYWMYTELSYMLSMLDKTQGNESCRNEREYMANVLKRNAKAFRSSSKYYSSRDRELYEKYRELFE